MCITSEYQRGVYTSKRLLRDNCEKKVVCYFGCLWLATFGRKLFEGPFDQNKVKEIHFSSMHWGIPGNNTKTLATDLDGDVFREYHVLIIHKKPSVDV